MEYTLLIRCTQDELGKGQVTIVPGNEDSIGEFILDIGDGLTFAYDPDSPSHPGDYVVVAIPQNDVVKPG